MTVKGFCCLCFCSRQPFLSLPAGYGETVEQRFRITWWMADIQSHAYWVPSQSSWREWFPDSSLAPAPCLVGHRWTWGVACLQRPEKLGGESVGAVARIFQRKFWRKSTGLWLWCRFLILLWSTKNAAGLSLTFWLNFKFRVAQNCIDQNFISVIIYCFLNPIGKLNDSFFSPLVFSLFFFFQVFTWIVAFILFLSFLLFSLD